MLKLLILGLPLFLSLGTTAQRRVIVPEGFGTLNEIIRKDTLAGGARKDPNTIYVLRRGGVYSLSGTILVAGFSLTLEAEEGTGPRPFIRMGFLEGGLKVDEVFEVRGNLTLRSIQLKGFDEFETPIGRCVAASSPNLKLRFYDCVIDRSGQTFIRLNGINASIFMLNCTVSRMGRTSDPDNGRVIDDRGNPVDSIVVENNTWYNVTSRLIRDGGGEVKYLKLNQNTFINGGQRFSSFGPVNQLIVTNNIIANPRFLGNTATSSLVATDFSLSGDNPVINFNYNNIYYDQSIFDSWQEIVNAGGTRIRPPFVVPINQQVINNALGILEEELTFSNGPVPPTRFILELELGTGSTIQDWVWTGAFDGNPWELPGIGYHSFSYPTTSQSFTGSLKNEPLGDLRWFSQYDVEWTVTDLIGQAQRLIAREVNNPVIEGSNTALLALQSEIANALTVASNPGLSGVDYASARDALTAAMIDFRASLIITQANPLRLHEWSIFPNPVTDQLIIQGDGEISIDILDLSGRFIVQNNLTQDSGKINVSSLPTGFYVVRLTNKSGMLTKKIFKK